MFPISLRVIPFLNKATACLRRSKSCSGGIVRASRRFILASTKLSLCRLISRRINKWAQGGLGKEYRKILLNAGQEVVLNAKVVKKGMPQKQAEK